MTFASDLLAEAGDEQIVYVVIGDRGENTSANYALGLARNPKVLTWTDAEPLLDYDHDHAYRISDCHAVYAWTATRVLFVVASEGATQIGSRIGGYVQSRDLTV